MFSEGPTLGRNLKVAMVILSLLFISACKVELYRGIPQQEGNEMLSLLMREGISTQKEVNKDNTVTLYVDEADVSNAMNLLGNYGYPSENFSDIADVFPQEGLISSPTEEKARFNYALSQQLAETLSQIDGVVKARVHLALEQNSETKDVAESSSASVFIKYLPSKPIDDSISQIKQLVGSSIPGLAFNKVSVATFPATDMEVNNNAPQFGNVLSVVVAKGSETKLWVMLSILVALLLAAIGAAAFLAVRIQKLNNA
ncbi:type III secretion system inner membrane ring lipoprotein SctJ [Pleionea sp. CnH1-48]|uniref:type III secretion system inner membrane ring lipoprotein SctJ n=1 Tax=Pleionea sp. CnH1-48 TaxID=2954494 RepID=UPI0020978745|nr:type III secretion inner membrane ring lipoprotein SctJ [Pleionea sp. CnH1-48]MCO7227011.1 type III secretion inner membrane ring lipoprotein SctJ [Pleionea sp. CnH1-48]